MAPLPIPTLLTDVDPFELIPSASKFSMELMARDKVCRISHDGDGVKAGHLCPLEEKTWFHQNFIMSYNANC